MMQDMDDMEASYVFSIHVCMLNQIEQSKISVLTVTTLGIVMLTMQRYMIFSDYFM